MARYYSRVSHRYVSEQAYNRWKGTGKIVNLDRVHAGKRGAATVRQKAHLADAIAREQKIAKPLARERAARQVERRHEEAESVIERAHGRIPAGREVEVSLTTKGGKRYKDEGRKHRDRRPLYVKVGLVSADDAPLEDFERAVKQTTETGIVPEGFKLRYADWEKGRGTKANAGKIAGRLATELQSFYGAAHDKDATLRADLVSEEEE